MGAKLDLRGQKFGRWTVLEEAGRTEHGGVLWKCQCECGTVRDVSSNSLRMGRSVSCGCYNREVITTHGNAKSEIHRVWGNLKDRCLNPKSQMWSRYGGRGITVCDEWKNDYVAFEEWALANGYEKGLSLDRIDNDGNYEPSNCRWATAKEQCRNRSNNRILTIDGESHCLSEWAEIVGINPMTINTRLRRGWSDHDAVYGRERVINRETYRNRVTNRLLTYKGETHCAVEWAEILGMNVNTIRGRLCRGWSVERTLGTPT